MNFSGRSVSLLKFSDNIRFSFDNEAVLTHIKTNYITREDVTSFKVDASITDPVTNRKEQVAIVLHFRGFFRSTLLGTVWKPEGLLAKDYEVFERNMPYILTFELADLKPFNIPRSP